MTTATDLPLLALLGKGASAPGAPLAAAGEDDRALDAALEFAALLLDAGVAGGDGEAGADAGKTLPDLGGKTLPGTPVPPEPTKPLLDGVPEDVLEPIIRRAAPEDLGDSVVDQIKSAQAQPAVLQRRPAGATDALQNAAARRAAEEAAAELGVMPGLTPTTELAPVAPAADGSQAASAGAGQPALAGLANRLAGRAGNGTPVATVNNDAEAGVAATRVSADAADAADATLKADMPRERVPATAATDTPPGLGALARAEAARKVAQPAADPARRAIDAVSALRAEPLAGGPAALPREGGPLSASPAASIPQLAGPDVMLGEGGWSRQFAERVGWVIQARVPQAQLSLNPEHLGPIEMSIEVEDAQARVQFTAAHAVTREAIEQSLPRLREMLEQQGLDLTQADVGADPNTARGDGAGDAGEEQGPGSAQAVAADADGDEAGPSDDGAASVLRLRPRGLVDTFV